MIINLIYCWDREWQSSKSIAMSERWNSASPRSATAGYWPVVADLESLLLDPAPAIAASLRYTLQQLGRRRLPDWSDEALRRTPVAALLRQQLSADGSLAEAGRLYEAHYQRHGRYQARLWPGSLPLLVALACDPRFELHYLTHIGAAAAADLVDRYGLQHHVRSIVTPEAPHCGGVRPVLLRHLVGDDEPQSATSWTLLSDHPLELLAAAKLGVRRVGLAYGRGCAMTLSAVDPDAIAHCPTDAACRLTQWAGSNVACRARPLTMRLH